MSITQPQSKPLLLYLSPYDILRPRTNQVSDVRFSEGFAQNGCEVHLVVPFVYRKDNLKKEDINITYGLENPITIHFLATSFKKDITGIWRMLIIAFLSTIKSIQLIRSRDNNSIVYIISRSAVLLQPLLLIRFILPSIFKNIKIIFWAHDFKKGNIYLRTYQKCDAILATNSSIANDLCEYSSISISKTFITYNPVTEAQVRETVSKVNSRKKINLEHLSCPLVVYTGKVAIDYNKELEHFLEAASLLPDFQFLCTGGKPEAIQHWKSWCTKKNIKNVIFSGYISDYSLIKDYQSAADVLVSYYTSQGHDVRYNLPNKLGEYMLSGNIIITPDYPATKDLLNNSNCVFVDAEDSKKLAERIQYSINNPELINIKTKQAREDIEKITFKKKTGEILRFLNFN
jgi:glycosyltransferase involved in cell wall biosynthesis